MEEKNKPPFLSPEAEKAQNKPLLRLMNLPVFSDEKELAEVMHVDFRLIRKFCGGQKYFYRRYTIPKSNGKSREILQPCKDLKALQSWILRNILDGLAPTPYATAYVKDKNLLHNVSPHSANRYFLCLDLEDFFPSISDGRVANIFRLIGYSRRAAFFLSALCTYDGGLPQGAVTSPALSNLVAAKLDRRIAGFTSRRNIVYTRYADDITLSSNNPARLCKAMHTVIRIIENERFSVNAEKTRMVGPRRQCRVTGLVKNTDEPRFGIGRHKKRQMRAIMHNLLIKGKTDRKYDSADSIIGWLSFLKGVDQVSHEQMNRTWEFLLAKSGPPSTH
jgi:retron-type reverse transcriptase